MKVNELIEALSELDPDAEVRLATQPSWPLAFHVRSVAASADLLTDEPCEHGTYDVECVECRESAEPVVWIVEGSRYDAEPYAPRGAWDAARSF